MSGKKSGGGGGDELAAAEAADDAGHRQEYGVVPPAGGYRRRPHKQRHHHHHKTNGKNDSNELLYMRPSDRVHYILGDEEQGEVHPLFSELEELHVNGDEVEWRETARWIKFEEDVEEGGNRWSKPHVATISLHSLFELRSCLLNGTVLLDMEATTLEQIVELVLENLVTTGQVDFDKKDNLKEALMLRKRHQHERKNDVRTRDRLPLIRSLADIGRNSSKGLFGSHRSLDKLGGAHHDQHQGAPVAAHQISVSMTGPATTATTVVVTSGQGSPISSVASATAAAAPGAGSTAFRGKNTLGVPGARGFTAASSDSAMPQSPSSNSLRPEEGNGLSHGHASSSDLQHKLNQAFMRKIPPGCEADNILVGEIDHLDRTVSAFVRLRTASQLGDLTEVPVPTRFIFILLGPKSIPGRYHEVGRAMATLMSDEVFHDVAYKSKSREDLLSGVDEFLDAVTILPPGAWDPAIRIEPPSSLPSQEARKKPEADEKEIDSEAEEELEREKSGLKRTGRLFGGLINDVKRKLPWYWSDFKDAFVLQSIASIFFLYFACLTPIITFGGLLGEATHNNIATMESLMSGLLCGLLFGFFSGQPLTILGSTGPVLIFENILHDFCLAHDFNYLNVRLWIGLWMATILMIMVAYDLSYLVCYITRFTEENFATLISVIFIFKALQNQLHIGKDFPIDTHPEVAKDYSCYCHWNDGQDYLLQNSYRNDTALKWCVKENGTLLGVGCALPNYVPNVYYFSWILFALTYILSIGLKKFKLSPYFPTWVRQLVSDFAVVLAILLMTLYDNWVGLPTPKLFVPSDFKPTRDDRGWLVPLFHEKNPFWLIPLAFIPATFSTILVFMDQQITAVIVNRKEYKLKKGCGYHLDLFVLSLLVAALSILGLPWFVAATVLCLTHVNSLKMESETSAPGEKPVFLGVREQRVTNIMIFLLVGLSVFFTPVLKLIPMSVLFGVFLYMGTSSLDGSQFYERILIFFMPQKYQPDYTFLRHVPTRRVHLFTAIQLTCFVMLWMVKSFKKTSITFPLMLVVIILARKCLDFVFTRQELKVLDDILPESTRRSRLDEKEKEEEEAAAAKKSAVVGGNIVPTESSGNVAIPLANGNILKIPVGKLNSQDDSATSSPSINISDQLTKSGVWKSIEGQKAAAPNGKAMDGVKKRGAGKKDALSEEEQRRLSVMCEEDDEEDCGITIKVDAPTPTPRKLSTDNSETPV